MKPKSILIGVAAVILVAGYGLGRARASGVGPATPASTSPVQTRPGPAPAVRPAVVIPKGTMLHVRLNEALGTATSRPGERFDATLTEPLLANGVTVAPRGTQVSGLVREAMPSGRLKGRAVLMLALESIEMNGRRIPIQTRAFTETSGRHRKRNSWWLGGGAGTGALIGGLAGGGAGLAIGAGSGAAVGLTGALLTGRKQVRLPAEAVVGFRLEQPVTIHG